MKFIIKIKDIVSTNGKEQTQIQSSFLIYADHRDSKYNAFLIIIII